MRKKIVLISSMLALMLAGCSIPNLSGMKGNAGENKAPVTLNVTTTWGGNDGGSATYQKYLRQYMKESGNNINDFSGGSDETFKQRIQMDFEVGGEPDVLFYFNGSDANAFIQAGKVISLETIREEYPDYASNLDENTFVPSEVDGKVYALPVYGYWEALFVNKKVCQEVGVKVPDGDTTWEEFMDMCTKIRAAGYTPIAASLAKEPHYWFEFVLYNQMSPKTYSQIPTSLEEPSGEAWQAGLLDLKEMYERGYFLRNTLYTSADESFQSFLEGEAAFLVDGSWRVGTIVNNAEHVEDYTVTYVPGKGERKSTDIIGGFSSGWYITAKAWEDPEKRNAAVEFVSFMTSNKVVSDFASVALSATALKNGAKYDDTAFNQLQKDAVTMLDHKTSISTAVQDRLSVKCRAPLFDGMPDIVTGRVEVEAALQKFFELRVEEAGLAAAE